MVYPFAFLLLFQNHQNYIYAFDTRTEHYLPLSQFCPNLRYDEYIWTEHYLPIVYSQYRCLTTAPCLPVPTIVQFGYKYQEWFWQSSKMSVAGILLFHSRIVWWGMAYAAATFCRHYPCLLILLFRNCIASSLSLNILALVEISLISKKDSKILAIPNVKSLGA